MVNKEIILRKISKLKGYVDELRLSKDITRERYEKDIRDRAYVERYLHMAIQMVFDSNPIDRRLQRFGLGSGFV